MQFTSGTQEIQGRSVNHDEYPYVCYNWPGGLRIHEPVPGCADAYEPRREFAILDNPVLAQYRRTGIVVGKHVSAEQYLRYIDVPGKAAQWHWKPEQIEHARRVFTLLAALS